MIGNLSQNIINELVPQDAVDHMAVLQGLKHMTWLVEDLMRRLEKCPWSRELLGELRRDKELLQKNEG